MTGSSNSTSSDANRSRRAFLRLGTLCGANALAGCPEPFRGRGDDPDPDPDWPMFARDAANTGASAVEGPTGDVSAAWTLDSGLSVPKPPALVEDVLYVGGSDHLRAIEVDSGDERWFVRPDDEGPVTDSAVAVADGAVYTGGGPGYLEARATDDGERRWRYDFDSYLPTGPTVADGVVYAGTALGIVHALADGERLWSEVLIGSPGRVMGAPAVADGVVYVATYNGHFEGGEPGTYALDAETGEELWSVESAAQRGTMASPVVRGDTLFVVDVKGALQALDVESGDRRWEARVDGSVPYSPAVTADSVFVPSSPMTAYEADSGDELWTAAEVDVMLPPAVAGDTVYVVDYGYTVHALSADEGESQWRFDLYDGTAPYTVGHIGSAPLVSEGRVFVTEPDGTVYALEEE